MMGLTKPATEPGTPPMAGSVKEVPRAAGSRPTEPGTPPMAGSVEEVSKDAVVRLSGASAFLQTLAGSYALVEATGRDGAAVELADGLRRALAMVAACGAAQRKLIFIGNGGSAAIASHQAVDYWKNGGVKATAFNDASLLTCVGNDYGYDRVFAEPIKRFAEAGDVVIAISSSGRSPNILRAAEAAREAGCELITCSGFDATNPLRAHGAVNFYMPSHNYGIVEVVHLSLLHGILDELMTTRSARPSNGR